MDWLRYEPEPCPSITLSTQPHMDWLRYEPESRGKPWHSQGALRKGWTNNGRCAQRRNAHSACIYHVAQTCKLTLVSKGWLHIFFNVGTRWRKWPASRPGCFNPGTHSIRNYVGPKAIPDSREKSKYLHLSGIEYSIFEPHTHLYI